MAELMVNDAGATAGTVDPQGETGRAGPVVLERDRRLSESVLWKIQREYFDRRGIAVWSKGDVPHYITNNPFIARAYARLVLAWLRDWQAAPGGAPSVPLDPSQPVYCVELGSGAGRFAYQFLKQFGTLHARSVLKDLPFKYVMTDFTERNIRHRQDHPFLRPYVESGRLDFARFDAERDTEIKLEISGTVLRPGAVKNPLAVMANSVFDSLPQDLFAVTGGQLHEGLVTTTNTGTVLDLADLRALSQVEVAYHYQPVSPIYYDDAIWNRVLLGNQERLSDTTVLFPRAALCCLRRLTRLAEGRLLLVCGDKGIRTRKLRRGAQSPPWPSTAVARCASTSTPWARSSGRRADNSCRRHSTPRTSTPPDCCWGAPRAITSKPGRRFRT